MDIEKIKEELLGNIFNGLFELDNRVKAVLGSTYSLFDATTDCVRNAGCAYPVKNEDAEEGWIEINVDWKILNEKEEDITDAFIKAYNDEEESWKRSEIMEKCIVKVIDVWEL